MQLSYKVRLRGVGVTNPTLKKHVEHISCGYKKKEGEIQHSGLEEGKKNWFHRERNDVTGIKLIHQKCVLTLI